MSNTPLTPAKLFLAKGADTILPDLKGRLALHYAAYFNGALVNLIGAGVDSETTDLEMRTPLYVALDSGWPQHVRTFRLYKANYEAKDAV